MDSEVQEGKMDKGSRRDRAVTRLFGKNVLGGFPASLNLIAAGLFSGCFQKQRKMNGGRWQRGVGLLHAGKIDFASQSAVRTTGGRAHVPVRTRQNLEVFNTAMDLENPRCFQLRTTQWGKSQREDPADGELRVGSIGVWLSPGACPVTARI